MNLLIIGALLLVGIAAIAGAVLLTIGEQRSEQSRTTTRTTGTVPADATAQAVAESRPTGDMGASRATRQLDPELLNAPPKPAAAGKETLTRGTQAQGRSAYVLNGQFHELVAELHMLSQHTADLEDRLRHLASLADHIEETQMGESPAGEEVTYSSPSAE